MWFLVTLTDAQASNVGVKYSTSYSTAVSADFFAVSGTLTFTPGQTFKRVSVSTKQDMWIEGSETFRLNLSDPTPGIGLSDGQAVGEIKDDDNCGVSCQ